jgi:hypothetical protein
VEKKGHQQQRNGIDHDAFQKHPDEEEYVRVESFWQIDKQHALIKYQRGFLTTKNLKNDEKKHKFRPLFDYNENCQSMWI